MLNEGFLTNKQIIEIDLFILKTLKEILLNKNFWFIDVRDFIDDEVLNSLNCIKQDIEERIMYNYWMWFLLLNEADEHNLSMISEKSHSKNISPNIFFAEENWNKIFKKELFYNHFMDIKITASGLKQIEELEEKLKEIKWFNWIFNKFKALFETFGKIKLIVWVLITSILVIIISIFDIQISGFIKNIPLLNSIINTELLESFEDVNENDEFYKKLSAKMSIRNSSFLKEIKDIKVKNINKNEKIFKIQLNDLSEKLINVKKDDKWKFYIDLPEELLNFRNKK